MMKKYVNSFSDFYGGAGWNEYLNWFEDEDRELLNSAGIDPDIIDPDLEARIAIRSQKFEIERRLGGMRVKISLCGWLAADNDGNLWLFPGKDNKPEKQGNEWVGFFPIPPDKFDLEALIVREDIELLKNYPKFILLES